MRPSRRTSAAVSPLEGGTEPFPAVTEEEMRERPSGEAVHQATTHNTQDKKVNTAVELRESNTNTDKTDRSATQEPLTNSSQVRT
jgi:hypothetical protein